MRAGDRSARLVLRSLLAFFAIARLSKPAGGPEAAMKRILVLVFLFSSVAASAGAQQDHGTDAASKEAAAAYKTKDWAKAATLYEQLGKQMTAPPPRVWLRLGVAKCYLGKYEEALAAFDKAAHSGAGPFSEYGKATVYAALNQPDRAFAFLDKAVQPSRRKRISALAPTPPRTANSISGSANGM